MCFLIFLLSQIIKISPELISRDRTFTNLHVDPGIVVDVVDTHFLREPEAAQGDVGPGGRVVAAGGDQRVPREDSDWVAESPDLLEVSGVVRVSIQHLAPAPPHHLCPDLTAGSVSVELRAEDQDAGPLQSHGRALGGAVALELEGLLAGWDGHPVVVDQAELHDAGLVFPQLLCQMNGQPRAVQDPGPQVSVVVVNLQQNVGVEVRPSNGEARLLRVGEGT